MLPALPVLLLPLLKRPIVIVGLALVASLLGNYAMWKLHTHDVKVIGRVEAERDQALADAKACSDGVAKLAKAAEAKQKQVEEALRKARARAVYAERKIQKTLQAKPVKPEDLCESARRLSVDKLKERNP